MEVYEIVFSPTGGTKKVADALASGLGPQAGPLDLTTKGNKAVQFSPEGLAVIAVPSFGGRVPAPAAQRLSALKGGGCPAVLVVVYGNRAYDDALRELQDLTEKAGFQPVAAVAAVAEHSILRQFAPGRPNAADSVQLREFAAQIRAQMSGPVSGRLSLPGNIPTKPAAGLSMVPKAGKACTECGVCAGECPVDAIDASRPRNADRHRCISCMRCVAVCPQRVRRLSPLMKNAAGLLLKKACRAPKENELFLLS